MPEVRGLLVTAPGSPLLPASAVRAVSQSKPLMLLAPALSAGVANIPTKRIFIPIKSERNAPATAHLSGAEPASRLHAQDRGE